MMVSDQNLMPDGPQGEILLYETEDGRQRLEVRFEDETVWLNQISMAELFQTTKQNISLHLQNIYKENELNREATVKDYLTVRFEGNREVGRTIEFYNLDAILAVGYRVRSPRGTQFRQWATERLREYVVKGFTIDDERLKNPSIDGRGAPDYFDEMLERIRDIRASEKRMYLRVRDIFALAVDYRSSAEETRMFFSIIQNKLHFAATGRTAAEIIQERADHMLPNMGLTTWKGDEVRKADVTTAKNYLSASEIDELNRIVVMWLDYAEDQARRRKQIFMKDWEERLNAFLEFNDRNVLDGAGQVSKQDADQHARIEYDHFAERRREHKEIHGQEDTIRALSEAANLLDTSRKSS